MAERKQISPDDAKWPDGVANLTDETLLFDKFADVEVEAFAEMSYDDEPIEVERGQPAVRLSIPWPHYIILPSQWTVRLLASWRGYQGVWEDK